MIAVALVAVVAFTLALWPVNDPVYGGRRLSSWVQSEGFHTGGFGIHGGELPPDLRISSPPSDPQVIEAISKAGPNALPLLVRMLGSKESKLEWWSQWLADKSPYVRKFVQPRNNIKAARQFGAVAAFSLLGPRAASAFPGIVPLLNDPQCAAAAMFAIMYIRPERAKDILMLTNVFRIRKTSSVGAPESFHCTAVLILSTFGPNAQSAVPFLLQQMSSTNGSVQAAAAIALARLGAPAEQVVPLILANLPRTNPPPFNPNSPAQIQQFMQQEHQRTLEDRNARMNIWALSQYAGHARVALPVISNLMNGWSMNLRWEAQAAIARITDDTNNVSQ